MTRYRSLFAVVLTLSLSACWPYLGDPYESYVDGSSGSDMSDVDRDELYLVGEVSWTEQRGEYWGEGSTDGDLVGGRAIVYVIDDGPRSALARWSGGDGNCQSASILSGNYEDALDVGDPASILLSGREDVRLPWLEDSGFWGATIDQGTSLGHAGGYDMSTVETDFGPIGGVELITTPRRLTITSPDMTGTSPPSVGGSGLRLTWTNQANVVLIAFTTVNGSGDAEETVYCGVSGSNDSFTLTLDDLPSLATASYTVVEVGNVSNGSGVVGDGIVNDVAAIYWQVGAVVQ
ncbi:MAG: hypothetical protein ACJATT_005643 [Myxococcota bacterium]|jgi:hypothetical protein